MGASFSGVALGTDGQWLLNSLVVVIIGGLGSIKGAAAGSLLYGMVTAFSPAYLPANYTFYSIILTFVDPRRRAGGAPERPVREDGMSRPDARSVATASSPACSWSCCRSFGIGLLHRLRDDPRPDARARRFDDRVPVGLRRHGLARAVADVRHRRVRGRQRRRRERARAQTRLGSMARGPDRARDRDDGRTGARCTLGADRPASTS